MRSSLIASLTLAERSQLDAFNHKNVGATERAKESFIAELRRVAGLKRFNAESMAPGLDVDIGFRVRGGSWMEKLQNDGFTVLGKTPWWVGRGERNPIWVVAIRKDVLAIEFVKAGKVHVWILQGRGPDKYGKRSVEQALKLLKGLDLKVEKGQPIRRPAAEPKVTQRHRPAPIVEVAPPPAPEPEPIEPEVQVHWDRLNDRRTIGQAYSALKLSGIDLGPTVPARADDLKNLIRRHPQSRLARAVIVNFIGA